MTILACIDSSRYSKSVSAYAARAALRLKTGVDLLHAIERHPGEDVVDRSGLITIDMADNTLSELARINEERSRIAQQAARLLLDHAAEQIRAAGVAEVRERVVFGSLIDALKTQSEHARLIIVGRRGEGSNQARDHLGSNLERIVRTSTHPVLIVPEEPRVLQRFVIAYDGSANADRLIVALAGETLLLEATCDLVMVGSDTVDHREKLKAAANRLRGVGYTVTEHLLPGHADEVILETVRTQDADLLVMGAYGHTRIRERIIGSTTTTLMRESTVPLLVIR
jgi:nucleotide-binding universal stress UspA family protein